MPMIASSHLRPRRGARSLKRSAASAAGRDPKRCPDIDHRASIIFFCAPHIEQMP